MSHVQTQGSGCLYEGPRLSALVQSQSARYYSSGAVGKALEVVISYTRIQERRGGVSSPSNSSHAESGSQRLMLSVRQRKLSTRLVKLTAMASASGAVPRERLLQIVPSFTAGTLSEATDSMGTLAASCDPLHLCAFAKYQLSPSICMDR